MKKNRLFFVFTILLAISLAAIGYFFYQNYLFKKENSSLKTDFALTTENLRATLDKLANTKIERNDFEQKYNDEKRRMDFLALQVSGIQGTVGFLEKLSKTDPELLQKYSKVYFLNDNYTPETLVKINPEYTYSSEKDYFFYSKTWPFLQDLLSAAINANIDIKIVSAYRSFGTQGELKSAYKMIYGSGSNQFSSDQGYSEHQLGTTLDFTTSKIGATYTGFEKTETYKWLLENAYKYGFILSYPENNKYYQFEPWHWRFVSKGLADKLHQEGKNFYDLDQRVIDQYLVFFFD